MQRIICVTNEKGGSGKSNTCINLSVALQRAGKSVVLVDTDPQATLRDWREQTPDGVDLPPVIGMDRPESLAAGLKSIKADIVIIDTPAKAEKMAARVIGVAHVAIIPVQTSSSDIWASSATVKLINAKREMGGQIEAAFLINRAKTGTKITKDMKEGQWNEYGIPALETIIGDRTVYQDIVGDGVTVFEKRHAEAMNDFETLVQELGSKQWV